MKPKAVVQIEEQLFGPPLPQPLAYLWRYFTELSMGLSQNGMGPPVVTWEGLRSWCWLMQIALMPWEYGALVRLGVMRANVEAEKMKREADKNRPKK